MEIFEIFLLLTAWITATAAVGNGDANEAVRSEARDFRLQPPYVDRDFNNRFWDYGGNVLIKNNEYVRLTQDLPGQRGFLISKLSDLPESFQVEFEFKLHGEGSSIYGDGMGFWLLHDELQRGQEMGNAFGLKDVFKGTGIFFDTYKNNRPGKSFPYVVLMRGDGSTPYDQQHDGLANEIAACSARGLHNSNIVSRARLSYVKNRFLSLELDYKGKNQWTRCFEVPGYDVGENNYIAFSAQTGELSENHDIYNVRVYSLNRPFSSYGELDFVLNGNKDAKWGEPESTKRKNKKGWGFLSFMWFVCKIMFFAGIAYGGFVAFRAYRRRQHKRDDFMYL